jgi:hypothetical protein
MQTSKKGKTRFKDRKISRPISGLRSLRPTNGFAAMMSVPPVDHYAFNSLKHVAPEHCDKANTWHRSKPSLGKLRQGIAKFGILPPAPPRGFSQSNIDEVVDTMLSGTLPPESGSIPVPHPTLQPYRTSQVISRPDYPRNKSPGLDLPSDIKTKEQFNVSSHYNNAKKVWSLIGRGISQKLPDSAIHSRVIPTAVSKDKVRPVWAYPVSVANEEARYFYAIMDRIQQYPSLPHSLGLEPGVGGAHIMSKLFAHSTVFETDWSSFDTKVPSYMIQMVFASLKRHFTMSDKDSRRYEKLVDYFINTPFRLPNGERYIKQHGVPSGSFFTNLVDTIVNAAVTRFLLRTDNVYIATDLYNGDDGIISICIPHLPSDYPKFIRRYQRRAESYFGFALSADKTRLYDSNRDTHFHYYGYDCYFTPGYNKPFFETDKLYASLLHPDRKVKTPIESCARTLGLLLSSFGQGPATELYNVLRLTARSYHLTKASIVEYTNQHLSKSVKHLQALALGALSWPEPDFRDSEPWHMIYPNYTSKYIPFFDPFTNRLTLYRD